MVKIGLVGDRRSPEAGATWWLEHLHGYRGSVERLVQRVKVGPPA